jgi:hypothetical protein
MRLFSLDSSAAAFVGGAVVGVATASDNRFSSEPQRMFDDWQSSQRGANLPVQASGSARYRRRASLRAGATPHHRSSGSASTTRPMPGGTFSVPEEPTVFTKWPSCIVGPSHAVELPVDTDWEIELVVAISRRASVCLLRARCHTSPVT